MLSTSQYEPNGQFGLSLAVDGGDGQGGYTFVFGAPGIRIGGNKGQVFVMRLYSDGSWQNLTPLEDPVNSTVLLSGGAFGSSVAISADGLLLVVSDINADSSGGTTRVGVVRVYARASVGTSAAPVAFTLVTAVRGVWVGVDVM